MGVMNDPVQDGCTSVSTAARPRRLERVGLLTELGESARASRARVRATKVLNAVEAQPDPRS
jgi:hypothetical protein